MGRAFWLVLGMAAIGAALGLSVLDQEPTLSTTFFDFGKLFLVDNSIHENVNLDNYDKLANSKYFENILDPHITTREESINHINYINSFHEYDDMEFDERAYRLAIARANDLIEYDYFEYTNPHTGTCSYTMKSDYNFDRDEAVFEQIYAGYKVNKVSDIIVDTFNDSYINEIMTSGALACVDTMCIFLGVNNEEYGDGCDLFIHDNSIHENVTIHNYDKLTNSDYYIQILDPYITTEEESKNHIAYINELRANSNRDPIKFDGRAYELAIARANDNIEYDYFEHTNPYTNTCPFTMKADFGFKDTEYVAENLHAGFSSLKRVSDSWMESQGHRYNYLYSFHTSGAIACVDTMCVFLGVNDKGFGDACSVSAEGKAWHNSMGKCSDNDFMRLDGLNDEIEILEEEIERLEPRISSIPDVVPRHMFDSVNKEIDDYNDLIDEFNDLVDKVNDFKC